MARPKKGNKPKDIRDATVGEVAAIGSTAVSVNKIAERAGLAVGTVYRYYTSKHELLSTVHFEVKQDIHNAMMDAASEKLDVETRLRAMWFALVNYGFKAPQEFIFAEMMSAEIHEPSLHREKIEQMRIEVLAEIKAGIEENILVEAPISAIETVLASPAISLARRASLSKTLVSNEELESVYHLVWRAIAKL